MKKEKKLFIYDSWRELSSIRKTERKKLYVKGKSASGIFRCVRNTSKTAKAYRQHLISRFPERLKKPIIFNLSVWPRQLKKIL